MTGLTCRVTDCAAPVGQSGARGLCTKHYQRWRAHGDPLTVLPRGGPRHPSAELFWAKVDRDGPVPAGRPDLGPCWLWTAATRNGYGAFNAPATDTQPRRRIDAHRWAYHQHAGPIPDGHELEHLCHTVDALGDGCGGGPTCPHRRCVNPAHLTTVLAGAGLRGVAARHAAQTRCPEGHPYDLVDSRGRRRCTRCVRAHEEARRSARGLSTRAERHAAIDAWLAEITTSAD